VSTTDSIADLQVLRRETSELITLRIAGAPLVEIGLQRQTLIAPEIVEMTIRNGVIYDVITVGPTKRKDGSWGIRRTAMYSWQGAREQIPGWLADLVRAETGAS
jgi:hypothetical protein